MIRPPTHCVLIPYTWRTEGGVSPVPAVERLFGTFPQVHTGM
jgi:hypothetical protein